MYEMPDPAKLRSATLIIGVTLLATSFAQLKVDVSKPVSFLGLPLVLQNENLVNYSLLGISLYYLFRYWFYSMRNRSTWAVRAEVFNEFTEVDDVIEKELETRNDVLDRFKNISHAGIQFEDGGSYLKDNGKWELWLKKPKKYSWVTFIRDADFAAPAVINIVAILFAVKNLVT